MYATDPGNLTEGPARPSSVTANARATKEDAVEEGTNVAGGASVETESGDEDPAATRQYWEVKWKKEGVHKVCIMCCVMFMI